MAYADVSLASTSVSNPVFGAPTEFFFDSPWASAGANDQSARNSESATAALGTAQSSTGNAPVSTVGGLSLSPKMLLIGGGVAVAVIVAAIWFSRHR